MILKLDLGEQSYDIVIERGAISKISSLVPLERKALILTDDGVPAEYSESVAAQCKEAYIVTLPHGEASKSFENYKSLLSYLIEKSFTRTDCMIAVGGGVVGDLCGFVASSYMRGIDFYNVPTTLLSQVDSSIGGKVAIDFDGIKNIVGAFYQPKKVIIDPETLKSPDKRQLYAGLAESIKMSLTSDKELFKIIEESTDIVSDIDTVIVRSLMIKKDVVEKDPKEKGLRRVLNFGHTIGHAIESIENGRLLHGECVALGMVPMCADGVREKLIPVLKKYDLPVSIKLDRDRATELVTHDKKAHGKDVSAVYVSKIGEFKIIEMKPDEIKELIGRCFN